MGQLEFPGFRYRKKYKPLAAPKCPCCNQRVTKKALRLTVWQSFRAWLLFNWDWAAKELIRRQSQGDNVLSLRHLDLLFALEMDAGANGQELEDRLAEIVDSYYQGEFKDIQRRGLKLPPDPEIAQSKPVIKSEHGE